MLRSIFIAMLTALAALVAGGLMLSHAARTDPFHLAELSAAAAPTTPAAVAQAQGPLVPPPLVTRSALPFPVVLTPTATIRPTATLLSPTLTPTPVVTDTLNAEPTISPSLVLLPTVTPTPQRAQTVAATPAITTAVSLSPTPAVGMAVLPTTVPTATPAAELPRLLIQPSAALAGGYRAQGSYSSQTVFDDGQIAQQQGSFAIIQTATENAYGSNQSFALTSRTADGATDSIAVFLVDDYIAVNFNDSNSPNDARATVNAGAGDWVVVQRSAGSSLVKAIQPITDLAAILPQLRAQADVVGQTDIDGQPALHVRLDDPLLIGDRLIRPLLGTSGDIRSFKLDAWLAEPSPTAPGDVNGYTIRYTFQVELVGARVLDPSFDEVRADQAVAWTYQVVEVDDGLAVTWPDAAPQPGVVQAPGFANGTFPLPDGAKWVGLANNVPEVIAPQSPASVAAYYRDLLTAQGWSVDGSDALLRCTKNGAGFQLLLVEDAESGGTRISVLTDADLDDDDSPGTDLVP